MSSRTVLTSPPELLTNEPRENLKRVYEDLLLSAQADASARLLPEKFVVIQGDSLSAGVPDPAVDLFEGSEACQFLQFVFTGGADKFRQRQLGDRTEPEATEALLCSYLLHLGMDLPKAKIEVGLVSGVSSAIVYAPGSDAAEPAVARVNRALLYLAFAASASR